MRADPRLDPARRADVGALRNGRAAAAGRRRDRARRVDTHLLALEQLGATILVDQHYRFTAAKLVGADVFLDEPSVTATENALRAAACAEGVTVLRNAASEPHVQDLANFLVALGARIEGIGTQHDDHPWRRQARRMRASDRSGSYRGRLADRACRRDALALTIRHAGVAHLRSILMNFERLGIHCRIEGDDLVIPAEQSRRIKEDFGGHIPKIEDQPWPAFPADTMSIAIVTATQCEGLVLMFEKMFESRMFFVDKLIAMRAKIVLCDPHRALVAGPSRLRASRLENPDIRARHGHAAGGDVRRRREHDQQRAADRARL